MLRDTIADPDRNECRAAAHEFLVLACEHDNIPIESVGFGYPFSDSNPHTKVFHEAVKEWNDARQREIALDFGV